MNLKEFISKLIEFDQAIAIYSWNQEKGENKLIFFGESFDLIECDWTEKYKVETIKPFADYYQHTALGIYCTKTKGEK